MKQRSRRQAGFNRPAQNTSYQQPDATGESMYSQNRAARQQNCMGNQAVVDLLRSSGNLNSPGRAAEHAPLLEDNEEMNSEAYTTGKSVEDTGSATVVGSAANSEWAFDASFTPALLQALQKNPNLSLDEVLVLMGDRTLNSGDPQQPQHHVTIARYGQTDENTSECRNSEHVAVLVANENYTSVTPLATPIAETNQMAGALGSRGYSTQVLQDQTSAQMGTAWNWMVNSASEGDDLVAYYSGHGAEEGLVGIKYSSTNNDIFSTSQVDGVVSSATSKGAHIRFIMDCCHSGAVAEKVRENRLNELAENAEGLGEHLYVLAADTCAEIKDKLMEHVHARAAALDPIQAQIDQIAANMPKDAVGLAKAQAIIAKLQAIYTKVQTAYDARADKLMGTYRPVLAAIATALSIASGESVDAPPASISDYRTLGAELDYCDNLANKAMCPVDKRISEENG